MNTKRETKDTTIRGRRNSYQGMNWCAPATRLAIYLRDALACVYCGATLETGAILTLDHVVPHSQGGLNSPINLVTACKACNSSRKDRTVEEFAEAVAAYRDHGVTGQDVIDHVAALIVRPLPRAEARELMARRGKLSAVLDKYR
jgi:5-methylcytosine-specific restriction endonuclease McrA